MPAISIITAVRNGLPLIERAFRSITQQTFAGWEWLAVDDGSTDGTGEKLLSWAAEDPRIRLLRHDENLGTAAARNTALRAARGEFITYLDHDDEHYPDYLAQVVQMRDKGDVLVFGYDIVERLLRSPDARAPTAGSSLLMEGSPHRSPLPEGEGTRDRHPNPFPAGEGTSDSQPGALPEGEGFVERVLTWDPGKARDKLFTSCMVTPLGLAHRRDLAERVGGFNELLWHDEDLDFIRRLARTGAQFAFVQAKSGIYHLREESASRMPRITERQLKTLLENWHAGRPIFADEKGNSEISNLKSEIPEITTSSDSAYANLECGTGTVLAWSLPLSTAINDRLGQKPDVGSPLKFGERKAAPRQDQSGNEFPHSKGSTANSSTISLLPNRNTTKKVAFVSPHCVLDFTNGAATATLDGLALLARSGFECQAFCSSRMDAWEEVLVEEILAQRGIRYQVRNAQIGPFRRRMIFTTHGQVAVTLFNSGSTRGGWMSKEEIAAFLTACEIFLTKNRPDVVWTYGGDPVSCAVQELAKRLDIPILFALHNFSYQDPVAFRLVDYVIVPTEFCRQYYWDTIGLASLYLPLVVDPARVRVTQSPHPRAPTAGWSLPEGEGTQSPHPNPLPGVEGTKARQYVTLVNPEPRKGIHVFARIAEVLSRRRPDIPLLIVEGAGKANLLPQLGIDLSGLKNLRIIPNAPDARGFHAMTKILVMPSLMENAGLVAMEAMINGIPVLASNRGGLPETIGDAGFLFDIPLRYTPDTREIPTAEEVEPWVETIIRLWDDPAEHERRSKAATERAQQWHPDRLAAVYCDFFGNLTHQPGPPLVPQEVSRSSLTS